MIISTDKRIFLSWGDQEAPLISKDGTPYHHHYIVERNGTVVGTTFAEIYIDDKVVPSTVYDYVVYSAIDKKEISIERVRSFGFSTESSPRTNTDPPTTPVGLIGTSKSGSIKWEWSPSQSAKSEVLGYLVADGNSNQPRGMVWNKGGTQEWIEPVPVGESRLCQLRAIDWDLNVSEPSDVASCDVLTGWTVYRYQGSQSPFEFRLESNSEVEADILIVGGGGSGGGGSHGGGGGAGGFQCLHNVVITSDAMGIGSLSTETAHKHTSPIVWDWSITVGEGGATVLPIDSVGNQGGDSIVGHLVSYGGGYGSREGGVNSYLPSDGASGGGAWPYEVQDPRTDYIIWYHGHGGKSIHNESGEHFPCGKDGPVFGELWNYTSIRAMVMAHQISPYQPQGHNGGDSRASSAWYQHTSGGGGGANWPAYGGEAPNGGLGRPCDIEGWPLWAETNVGGSGNGFKYIPWFCGGGAGKERPNLWSYRDGQPGYGGGGACGVPGGVNTGGGGGGNGWLDSWRPPGDNGNAPGPAGGRGVVIIRIPTSAESQVMYPLPIPDTGIYDEETNTWTEYPDYPSGIRVTRVPKDQPHLDEQGDEIIQIWGWPNCPNFGDPYDHYGWDGTTPVGW